MSGEDKVNPVEKVNVQSEYYLETLLTNAFKGKGFLQISELFEHNLVCPSQRHSKVLLNQLDRLIHKELDRNEFTHVSLLLKCIQHFCKSESREDLSLIQQGLVSKMVMWFERTLEFLKICKDRVSTISGLVENFYDTAQVICNCKSEDGVKQLLDPFLFTLGFVIMQKWPPYNVRLEAAKTLNLILGEISREEMKKLNSSVEICTLMQGLARELFEVGDYNIQVYITEALCRMVMKKMRENFAQKWFEDGRFAEAFKEISDQDFETDCRKFLNYLNSRLDVIRVHTFPCISVSTDMGVLTKPQDDKLEHFWIDFNVGTQGISFYIDEIKSGFWEPVRLQRESLSGYSFEECNGQKLLNIHLKISQSVNKKVIKYIKMTFELEHDIQNATIKTYGEDLQMEGSNERVIQANAASSTGASGGVKSDDGKPNRIQSNKDTDGDSSYTSNAPNNDQSSAAKMHHKSPQKSDRSKNLEDGLTDAHEGSSSGEQQSALVIDDVPRLLEFNEENKVSAKNSVPTTSDTKGYSPKQQSAEKRALAIFEFPKSSESASDVEVSVIKEKVPSPEASSSRKTNDATNRPRTQSCQKTEAKKTVDYKDFLSTGSERSWIMEYQRKPSAKSADYSRKRQKRKSKLKVLPLSSQSSDEDKDRKRRGQPLKFTEIRKGNKQRGMAESLSFSEIKLPGISALLTPRHSNPQTSGTLHMSDLDQDTMDPVQEMSSPGIINKLAQSDTARKMDIESNEDQIELIKGLYPSGKAEDLKKKRKRSNNEDEEEFTLKPRKLFSSAKVSTELEDTVFKSDSHESEISECSFISSFESFTECLKKKMMTRYNRMEVRAQDVLKNSHLHVSNLMNQIQQSNFRKLDHFRSIVAEELSSLETETHALKELEKETLDFWEAQTVKINEFCTNQRQRIEAMDHTINESLSILKTKEEGTTDIKESLQKL